LKGLGFVYTRCAHTQCSKQNSLWELTGQFLSGVKKLIGSTVTTVMKFPIFRSIPLPDQNEKDREQLDGILASNIIKKLETFYQNPQPWVGR